MGSTSRIVQIEHVAKRRLREICPWDNLPNFTCDSEMAGIHFDRPGAERYRLRSWKKVAELRKMTDRQVIEWIETEVAIALLGGGYNG